MTTEDKRTKAELLAEIELLEQQVQALDGQVASLNQANDWMGRNMDRITAVLETNTAIMFSLMQPPKG